MPSNNSQCIQPSNLFIITFFSKKYKLKEVGGEAYFLKTFKQSIHLLYNFLVKVYSSSKMRRHIYLNEALEFAELPSSKKADIQFQGISSNTRAKSRRICLYHLLIKNYLKICSHSYMQSAY